MTSVHRSEDIANKPVCDSGLLIFYVYQWIVAWKSRNFLPSYNSISSILLKIGLALLLSPLFLLDLATANFPHFDRWVQSLLSSIPSTSKKSFCSTARPPTTWQSSIAPWLSQLSQPLTLTTILLKETSRNPVISQRCSKITKYATLEVCNRD